MRTGDHHHEVERRAAWALVLELASEAGLGRSRLTVLVVAAGRQVPGRGVHHAACARFEHKGPGRCTQLVVTPVAAVQQRHRQPQAHREHGR